MSKQLVSSARILERGYGYRKPYSIQFLTLCQAYLTTGSLTWHEAAKSNSAAEAKEAVLKELRTLTNLKSWRYLHPATTPISATTNLLMIFTSRKNEEIFS